VREGSVMFWTSKKLNIYIWLGSFGTDVSFPYLPICIIYLFVYITRWRFKLLSVTQWTIFYSVSSFKWSLCMPLFYYTK
jgi:hypothetical protein